MGKSSLREQEELFDYKVFQWHSRGQRFDPAYLHHRSLENLWFSRLFAALRYFYFARYFSDQSFDQNYEMSKKSNLFQEVGGSFLASRFFHLILATSHIVSLS